jgi:hypothetical protein
LNYAKLGYLPFFLVFFGATFPVVFFAGAFFDGVADPEDFFTDATAELRAAFADFSALVAIVDAFFIIGFASTAIVLAASLTAAAIFPAALPMVLDAISKMPASAFFEPTFFFVIYESFYW